MTHVFIDPLRWLRKFHILFEQFIIWKIGYVFLSYLYKEQVSWFFSKSTHNTKRFLNANCNDDSWDRRRELKEREILFHFFIIPSFVCYSASQSVYHQIHRKLRSFTAMTHISVPYSQLTCYGTENEQPISIPHSLPAPALMACPFSIP